LTGSAPIADRLRVDEPLDRVGLDPQRLAAEAYGFELAVGDVATNGPSEVVADAVRPLLSLKAGNPSPVAMPTMPMSWHATLPGRRLPNALI